MRNSNLSADLYMTPVWVYVIENCQYFFYQTQIYVQESVLTYTEVHPSQHFWLFHRSSGNSEFFAGGKEAVDMSASRAAETDWRVDSTCKLLSGVMFYYTTIQQIWKRDCSLLLYQTQIRQIVDVQCRAKVSNDVKAMV